MWVNRPWVEEQSEFYYESFQVLTHSRPIGFGGPLPVPLAEIECFMRLYDVFDFERVAFVKVFRRIDLAYLELIDKRKKNTLPQPKR